MRLKNKQSPHHRGAYSESEKTSSAPTIPTNTSTPTMTAGPVPVSVESTLPDLTHLLLEDPSTTPSPAPIDPTNPTLPTRIIPDGPKQSAPFQFGSRFLHSEAEVFTYNAWDHVDPTSAYKSFSATQLAAQRLKPATEFDKKRFNAHPAKWWDLFYKNNKDNFFKDRKWLQQEFPVLAEATAGPEAGEVCMVELGCGAGNTLFPVLALNRNPGFRIVGADFSERAVEIVRGQEAFKSAKGAVEACVYDLAAGGTLPEGVEEGSVDVVIMVFVFSALAPEQWSAALGNVRRMLKEGGKVLFRDYGRGDLAQVRFKAGRYLEENFYVRGDGTRVYFFELWELRRIFTGVAERQDGEREKWGRREEGEEGKVEEEKREGDEREVVEEEVLEEDSQEKSEEEKRQLEEEMARFPEGEWGGFAAREMGVDRRLLVNRKRQLKMYRCWMQAVFEKL